MCASTLRKILEIFGYKLQKNDHDFEINQLLDYLQPKKTNFPLVRIGEGGDGSYLVPDDLEGISLCLSPGSNQQWNFEKYLLKNFGIKSAIMDRLENKPVDLTDETVFIDSWLGVNDDTSFTTMEKWINNLDPNIELMLQMDIEGAEYDILFTLSEKLLQRFRIMVIEFHYTYKFQNRDLFLDYYSKIFARLQRHFEVVHFHANNCCGKWSMRDLSLPIVFELTLLRRDRINQIIGISEVPHHLDTDCVPGLPTLEFKFPKN
jgi:hypothetical protein